MVVEDRAVRVQPEVEIWEGVQHGLHLVAPLPELLTSLHKRGDVNEGGQQLDELTACRAGDGSGAHQQPARLAAGQTAHADHHVAHLLAGSQDYAAGQLLGGHRRTVLAQRLPSGVRYEPPGKIIRRNTQQFARHLICVRDCTIRA